ncbi:phospholipase A2 [Echria macrotheca]|uniref:Putative phospholipase n=1 Tax=Echria macrotheca TaxID=438768 RepID=A0AAJ0FA66_9PEZI|nr:phospholipase A2 [Echria macrotheca]
MASPLLSRLNPVPAFPAYTGPHKVGTVDVEIAVSELSSQSPTPKEASAIDTVQFRIFYPATPDSRGKRITWLPAPQRLHVSAYVEFLGAGSTLASVLSFLPRHLHYTSIPVHKNATVLQPTSTSRWPTVVFSHGLGGNRNTYSHVAGSLASHGVVVICPEHRDGSAAISLIRDPQNQGRFFVKNTRKVVPYIKIPHSQTSEIWEKRNEQLRIRLWELGLMFDAVLGIDNGDQHIAQANMNASTPEASLMQLKGLLDIQEPGRVIFAGHSFGAATMVQLLKSTYYAERPEVANMSRPLFTPSLDSPIRKQITNRTPLILLDMWCFPLLSAATSALYNLPLPCYDDTPSAPGGSAILVVESSAFFKWKDHLHAKARILSANPTERIVSSAAFERPESGVRLSEPNFFYVENSAHLNQSDFGILFPWLTKRVFGAEQPERCLRLNLRAQLQMLRTNGYVVAPTGTGDLVDGPGVDKNELAGGDTEETEGISNDKAIFERKEKNGPVEAWRWIDIVGLGGESGPGELEILAGTRRDKEQSAEEGERDMEGEMEPGMAEEDGTGMKPGVRA